MDMCKELEFDKQHTDFILQTLSTIIMRSTYYIFCMRSKLGLTLTFLYTNDLQKTFILKIYIPYRASFFIFLCQVYQMQVTYLWRDLYLYS